jgi:hypothetical protein
VVGGLVTTGLGILGGVVAYSTGSPPDQPPESGGPEPRVIQARQLQEQIDQLQAVKDNLVRIRAEQPNAGARAEEINDALAMIQRQIDALKQQQRALFD